MNIKYKKIIESPVCLICGSYIIVISLIALFANFLSPYSFDEQFMDSILSSPSYKYWLGTDHLGRDLLSRIIYGSRMSMAVGVFTALISTFLGVLYGLYSGWKGGLVDRVMMRILDMMYSIPILVLLILVKVIFDSIAWITHPELKALVGTLVALSLVNWATLARVTRGQVLQTKSLLYIEAAEAIGSSSYRIVMKHILPNILTPIIILLTFQIPSNILFESMLSFLGLGLQPPYSSWGVLVDEGWRSISTYPHLIIAPSILLFLTMIAFQLFGDKLRDILDPNMRDQV